MRTLKGLRADCRKNQGEVARELGMKQPQYNCFEGIADDPQCLASLAKVLGVKAIQLRIIE